MVGISLPDQTDATLGRGEKLIELAFPLADKPRRRVQVRNLARDVAQIGTEHIKLLKLWAVSEKRRDALIISAS